MRPHSLTVICAWCHEVIAAADADAPITHTICPSCLEWALTHRTLDAVDRRPIGSLDLPANYFGDCFKA